MKLEINLANIERIAQLKGEENISFQTYLKAQDSTKIDKIVLQLNSEITPQINCTDCGNCCQNVRPLATNKEMSKFVEEKDIETFRYLKSMPCKFHKYKKCTDYENRPDECRLYPYIGEGKFIEKTYGVLQNYEICPIVFNVFESLKVELEWSYKRKAVSVEK